MDDKIIVKNSGYIEAQRFKDGFDGWLGILENNKNMPFEIKRAYYIYNLFNHENVARGRHAHKELKQVLFCINGSCTIMLDDGKNKQKVKLNKPHVGLYLGTGLWHEMKNFQNNCILLVFASDLYKESDYIRDYKQFIDYINGNSI